MSILITGATGFIGRHLAWKLAERGESVRVLCRATADTTGLRHDNVRIFYGNILERESIADAIKGCNRVFHLAASAQNWAKNCQTFIDVNVNGLKNVLDAAVHEGVQRVVFTSTSLTVGPSNGTPATESAAQTELPFNDYDRSKRLAEDEVGRYVQRGLHVVIVNPTRVFGPGLLSEANSATRMIQWYLKGKWRVILGDGSLVGNYAFVHDVVDGHILAMERGRAGERYVLGGENVSFDGLFDLISEISGCHYRLVHVPGSLALTIAHLERLRARWFNHYPLVTPGWIKVFLADWPFSTAKAETELGYRFTPLREALMTTIEWLRRQR